LYWYLQYFAALGLFALIRLWVLIFDQISINFGTRNALKSITKAIQNRIDFLIEFWTVFFKILAPFWHLSGSHFGAKIAKKGAAVKEGDGLWQRLRARSVQGYPQTLKMVAQGGLRTPKLAPNGAPSNPKNTNLDIKTRKKNRIHTADQT